MPHPYYVCPGKDVSQGSGKGRGKGRANFLRRRMCPIGSITELGPAKRPDRINNLGQEACQGLG